MKPRKAPRLMNLESMEVTYPKWIWYPYIPANCATMLFGVGGIGKSYMACEIAAALSAGRPLPGQNPKEVRRHKVLLLSAEDSPSAVIKPRLMKCGADLTRVFVPAEPFTLDDWGMKVLHKYVEACAATIIIIDPIVHYMGGKIDMNKMNEVRAVTGALHQQAMETNCGVILIHHARKGSEGQGYEQAAGSADFVNAVRSVCFAHKAPDGTSILSHVKTNYGVYGKGLAYFIDEEGFHWVGEYDDTQLLNPKSNTKVQQAKSFLKEALRGGPVHSVELIAQAKDEGFNITTLNRAKVGHATSIKRYEADTFKWYWRAAGDETEPKGTTVEPMAPDDAATAAYLAGRPDE